MRELEELPPHVDTKDLTYVERADGTILLVSLALLEELRKARMADGTTLYDRALREPDEYLDATMQPALASAQEYAEDLVRAHISDYDHHNAETRATWLIDTIARLNRVGNALEGLGHYLAHAKPGKRTAKEPLTDLGRDVHAAILKDVHDLGSIAVGEKLDIPDDAERMRIKRTNQNASNAIKRGLEILERAFGEAGWRVKAERLRALRIHYEQHKPGTP